MEFIGQCIPDSWAQCIEYSRYNIIIDIIDRYATEKTLLTDKTRFEWFSCGVKVRHKWLSLVLLLSELLRDQVLEASCTTRNSSANTKTVEMSQTKHHRSASSHLIHTLLHHPLYSFHASFASFF